VGILCRLSVYGISLQRSFALPLTENFQNTPFLHPFFLKVLILARRRLFKDFLTRPAARRARRFLQRVIFAG
jgi:hypothetical protein